MPCAITVAGRVCGTPIGMAFRPTTRATSSRATIIDIAVVNRSHWISGSGPDSSRNRVPAASVTASTTSSGAR